MKLSVSQPYFCPFPGFFEKAARSDLLVILDDVQFPRGTTWTSRNRFKNHQGTLWITVPVWKKGLGLQEIGEVRICHDTPWGDKALRSLKNAYTNAPWFGEHLPFLEKVFSGRHEKLLDLNMELIHYLMGALQLPTKVLRQSETGIRQKGDKLIIKLIQHLSTSHFLAQHAAEKHLNLESFQQAGIGVSFFRPRSLIYPQLWGDFIGNLSTFDLLFNCGPKARDLLLRGRKP